jgi:hypothetical protein
MRTVEEIRSRINQLKADHRLHEHCVLARIEELLWVIEKCPGD